VACPKAIANNSFSNDPSIVGLAPIAAETPNIITLLGMKVGNATVDIRYTDGTFYPISVSVLASPPLKVQVDHTQDLACQKTIANNSFSSDPGIVGLAPVAAETPKTITLLGLKVGNATVFIRYTDETFDPVLVNVSA
jgi:hypothetical protein